MLQENGALEDRLHWTRAATARAFPQAAEDSPFLACAGVRADSRTPLQLVLFNIPNAISVRSISRS